MRHEATLLSLNRCSTAGLRLFPMLLSCAYLVCGGSPVAQDGDASALPEPQTDGGKPLMQALRERKTTREFSAAPIPRQLLSDMLWAAFGVNRPETGHRTAPSAMNAQEIDIYVASADGVYLYEAREHRLKLVLAGDVRPSAGARDPVEKGPVVFVYVADFARMTRAQPDQKAFYAGFDAGCISQNVYLFCASAGLATVVHELNRPPLAKAMGLRSAQQIILAQTIGFPTR
jgi:SagB-type dehydrogenase family enzyme